MASASKAIIIHQTTATTRIAASTSTVRSRWQLTAHSRPSAATTSSTSVVQSTMARRHRTSLTSMGPTQGLSIGIPTPPSQTAAGEFACGRPPLYVLRGARLPSLEAAVLADGLVTVDVLVRESH